MATILGLLEEVGMELVKDIYLAMVEDNGADIVALEFQWGNLIGDPVGQDACDITEGVVLEGDGAVLAKEELFVVGGDGDGGLQGNEGNPAVGVAMSLEIVAGKRLLELQRIVVGERLTGDNILESSDGG